MVHEAVVTQAHAKRHCLLPRLAITLKWNKKERALGGLAPRGLCEAGVKHGGSTRAGICVCSGYCSTFPTPKHVSDCY